MSKVYDDQDQHTGISPAEQKEMERSALRGSKEDLAAQEGFYMPDDFNKSGGGDKAEGKSANREQLNDKENDAGGGAAGGAAGAAASKLAGMAGPAGAALKVFQKLSTRKNRRRTGAAAAAGGGIAALLIAAFFALLPLKVLSIVTNLKNDAFTASTNALSKVDDVLLRHYIVKAVVPGMVKNNCTSTLRDKSCADVSRSNNIVSALWVSWFEANIEGKMAREHGIEIIKESTANGPRLLMRIDGINEDLDLGTYNGDVKAFKGQAFAAMSKPEARRALKAAYRGTTFSHRMHYRFVVKPLVERKYGVRACIAACKIRGQVNGTIEQKKMAGKLYLVERVLVPRTEMMGLALECAISGFDCANPGPADQNGEQQTQFEKDIQLRLAEYRAKHGGDDSSLENLQKESDKIRTNGFIEYMVKRIAGETVGTVAGKTIPIIGWVDMVARLVSGGENLGPALRHINFVMNSRTEVAMAAMYLTSADEQKTGYVDGTIQGSIAANFDEVVGGDQGGGAMEATPLYQAQFAGNDMQMASAFDLFRPKAYAQETEKATAYTCDDGKAVPLEEYMCPEVKFGATSTVGKIGDNISAVLGDPSLAWLQGIADIYLGTVGKLFDLIGSIAGGLIPSLPEAITSRIGDLLNSVFKNFLVNPVGDKMSGGRNFELTAAGMWVMGLDDVRYNLGAQAITPQQAAAIRREEYNTRLAEFTNKPLYARLFDTQDSMSMTSRLALSVPTSGVGVANRFSALLSDPLGAVSRSFATIFRPKSVDALWERPNPVGLQDYGYPADDPIFSADPEEYVEQRKCDDPDIKKKWGEKAVDIDPATGIPINRETEGCLLMKAAISNGGSMFDTKHTVPNQARALSGGGGGAPAPGGSTTLPTGDTIALAKQIIDARDRISFQTPEREAEFRKIVATGKASECGSPTINPKLLGVILALSQSYKLVLGTLTDGRSGCGGQHTAGNAVDINGINPLNGGQGTGNRIGDPPPSGKSDPYGSAEQPILKEFYGLAGQVLSTNGGGALGQYQCFTNPGPAKSPSVLYFPDDTCDHIHLDVR